MLLSVSYQMSIWHQTARTTMHATHYCSCSYRAPSLSWTIFYFSLVILDTLPTQWNSWKLYLNVCDKLEETAFSAVGSVLCYLDVKDFWLQTTTNLNGSKLQGVTFNHNINNLCLQDISFFFFLFLQVRSMKLK